MHHQNKSRNTEVEDIILAEDISIQLDSFMRKRSFRSIIVFRLKDDDCSECKRFFTDLYLAAKKKTDQVVLLSRLPGYRSVLVFKEMSGINDSVINMNRPIAKMDQSLNPYVFIYNGNKTVNCFVPLKTDRLYNEQKIDSMINYVNNY
jgi:hypothetical protein